MKLARYAIERQIRIGLVEGEAITHLSGRIDGIASDMIPLISGWAQHRAAVETFVGRGDVRVSDVTLLAPIARPGKIWGIGLNYADHIEEAKMERPKHQSWFVMAQTSVAGPYQPIQLPKVSAALDYEAELVFIIGRGGRHIPRERAADSIFGYCVGDDVSVRDWQFQSGQFSIGKSFDTHAPFGPWIVTPDEIDAANLPIRSFVNGEKRQDSNTRHLIFDPAAQIAHLSQAMTLEPGDVFFTGTPGGVGVVRKPPLYLKAGDRVRVEIDGIGYIENEVVMEG
jgi:ureidoglycolate lyase